MQDWEWDPLLDAELPFFETFPFLDLPPEVRLAIYKLHLLVTGTIDLNPSNKRDIAPRLRILKVNKQLYEETSHFFYGRNMFRLFSTDGRYFESKHHILTKLRPRTRAALSQLELRLGAGFTRPPRTWTPQNIKLGLKDCKNMRVLKIFIQFDPMSHEVFKDWRMADDGYSKWARDLLQKLLQRLPSLEVIIFDGCDYIRKDGHLMRTLLEEVQATKLPICWGPESGWDDGPDKDPDPASVVAGPTRSWYTAGGLPRNVDTTSSIPLTPIQLVEV